MAEGSRRSKATLEIDVDGHSPAGVLTGDDGLRLAFSGWTEFASVIQRWREAAQRSPSGARIEPEGQADHV